MKKTKLLIAAVFILLFGFQCNALGSEYVNNLPSFIELFIDKKYMKIDGEPYKLNTAPVIDNGRALISANDILEKLNYKVTYNNYTNEIYIQNEECNITLNVNSQSAYKVSLNNENTEIRLDAAPKIINGSVMIPVQLIEKINNCKLIWNGDDRKITLAFMTWGGGYIGAGSMIEFLKEKGKADNGITVAVIDSGVDVTHTYLADRIVNAYNSADDSNDVNDLNGHGTHVAGIIVNSTPEIVKIMPIKPYDRNGNCSIDSIVKAIQYGVNMGAKVINISLSKSIEGHNSEIEDAINEAVRNKCAVIVAAGNERGNTEDFSPACVDSAIVVTASDKNGEGYAEANRGKTITVSAPGVSVVSSIDGDTFGSKNGTSMAAAYVSASAAMIMMDLPEISCNEIKNLMIQYSDDKGSPGFDTKYGGGILNLNRYVYNRKNGIIYDFTISAEERIKELDIDISKAKDELNKEHIEIFGIFLKDLYARDLVNRAVRLYERKDYFAAGYYFENAIMNGDCESGLAKNNLAYLIRRGEYVSNNYKLEWLLSEAKAEGQPLAYINHALLEASKNNWMETDRIIKEFAKKDINCSDVIKVWQKLSYNNDTEGDLVLGLMMRYGLFDGEGHSQREYLDRAAAKYPQIPVWLYENCN